jgi:hypothetical protein
VKRLRVSGLLVLAALLVGAATVSASTPASAVTKRDAASTKAFIAAQERYGIVAIRSAPAIITAEDAFAAQIRARCPGVLTHHPNKLSHRQDLAVTDFVTESVLALDINAFAPLQRLINRTAVQQRRLRFSDPALQWQVRVNGAASAAYFALRPPNLCADARSLASSAFTRITSTGTRFVRGALALAVSASVSPSSLVRMMRSYAPAAAAIALKRLPELQRTLDQKLGLGRHTKAVLRALGLLHRKTSNFARPGVVS